MSVLCEGTTYVKRENEIIKILKIDLEYFLERGWSSVFTSNTCFTVNIPPVTPWGHVIKVGK